MELIIDTEKLIRLPGDFPKAVGISAEELATMNDLLPDIMERRISEFVNDTENPYVSRQEMFLKIATDAAIFIDKPEHLFYWLPMLWDATDKVISKYAQECKILRYDQ